MTTKHTPGPWLYRGKSDSVHRQSPDPRYQFGDVIFQFHDDNSPSDADLTLILAAPELLAALTQFVSHYPVGVNPELDAAWNDARAAITKAEEGNSDYD